MTKSQKKRKKDCNRKVRFDNEQYARSVARKMNRRGCYVEAYYCKYCNGWHVGRMKRECKVMEAFRRLELERRMHA